MPEVSNNKLDENLGISLDFGDITDDPILENNTNNDDDLLESSLKNNVNSEEDDLFKTPEGLDIDTALNDMIKDTSDNPDSTDDKTKSKVEPTNATKDNKKEEKETSGSLTIAYAKILQEQGLSDFNEEEYLKTVEEKGEAVALIELFDKNAEAVAQSKLKELDEYTAEYTKLRQSGFTVDEAATLMGNRETVDSITTEQLETDEELQEQIIREVSTLQGKSKDEIDEDIQLLKDTDKLKSRSEKNLAALQNYYKKLANQELINRQAQEKANKEAADSYIKQLKENIYSTEEVLKGRKINKQTQDKVLDLILKPVKLDDGSVTNAIWAKRKENQQEFDKRLAYLIHIGLFDGSTKAITTDARTKAVQNIQKTLESGRKFSSGAPIIGNEKDMNSRVDAMADFLDIE